MREEQLTALLSPCERSTLGTPSDACYTVSNARAGRLPGQPQARSVPGPERCAL